MSSSSSLGPGGLFPEEYVPLSSAQSRSASKRPNSPSLPTPTAPPQSSSTGKVKRGRKSATVVSLPQTFFPVSLSRGSSRERSEASMGAGNPSSINNSASSSLLNISASQSSSDFASHLRHNVPTSGLKSLGGLGAITWTEAEDAELSRAIATVGTADWTAVAQLVPRRTAQQCMSRWLRALKQGEVKKDWDPIEDEVIKNFVLNSGDPSKVVWTEIAQKLEGRIGKQCRERWFFHLDPNIKRTPFDEEEDRRLFEAQRALGNKWSEIARLLPGRNENSVKNRWNSVARRKWFVDHNLPLAERDALALMQHAKLSHLDWKIEENLKLASKNATPEMSFMSGRSYEIGIGWVSQPLLSSSSVSLPVPSVTGASRILETEREQRNADNQSQSSHKHAPADPVLAFTSPYTVRSSMASLPSNFSLRLSRAETLSLCSVETDSIISYRMCGDFPQIRLRLNSNMAPEDAPFVPFSLEIGSLFQSAGILHNIKNVDADLMAPLSSTMRNLVVFPVEDKGNHQTAEKIVNHATALFGAHGTQWIYDTMNNEYLYVKSGRRPGALSTSDSASSPDGFSTGGNGFKVSSSRSKKSIRKFKGDFALSRNDNDGQEKVTQSVLIPSAILSNPTHEELMLLSDGRLKINTNEEVPINAWSVSVLSPEQHVEPSPDTEQLGGPVDRFQGVSISTDGSRTLPNQHSLLSSHLKQDWHVSGNSHQRKESVSMDLASPGVERQNLVRTSSSGSNGGSASVHFTLKPFVLQNSLPFSEQFTSFGDTSASTSFVVPAPVPRSSDHSRSAPTFLSSADLNRESASAVFINALSSPNSSGTQTPGSKSKSDLPSPIDISNLFEFKHVPSPMR
jgi:hypothetical protein